jgi:hypothetical protein
MFVSPLKPLGEDMHWAVQFLTSKVVYKLAGQLGTAA